LYYLVIESVTNTINEATCEIPIRV
jgi:hypothetical protein